MSNQCALFTSCCNNFSAQEIIKRIKDVPKLEGGVNNIEDIWQHEWHIDTKYYTADINLCHTEQRTIGNKEFAELVQAVIIFFNPDQEPSFEKAKSWLPFLNELSPSIQMLVCESCNDENTVKRKTVQEWCIENEFELVELSPIQLEEDDDDFGETTGIKRIIQALHAHTWSNLVMKENPSIYSPYMKKLMEEEKSETCATDDSQNKEPTCPTNQHGACGECQKLNDKDKSSEKSKTNKSSSDRIDNLIQYDDDMAIFDAAGTDDPVGSFESLFARFSLMKEKAENLPLDERKAYAEKVAVSFWKALGGDEEELDGLDSSDGET